MIGMGDGPFYGRPQKQRLDLVKVTTNLALTALAGAVYLLWRGPMPCESFAAVLLAMGANIVGLVQRPPMRPLPALE